MKYLHQDVLAVAWSFPYVGRVVTISSDGVVLELQDGHRKTFRRSQIKGTVAHCRKAFDCGFIRPSHRNGGWTGYGVSRLEMVLFPNRSARRDLIRRINDLLETATEEERKVMAWEKTSEFQERRARFARVFERAPDPQYLPQNRRLQEAVELENRLNQIGPDETY